ncbi:hypothetical protein KAK07_14400 [Ideonella sp. 4Y16]|uniref:hypothetical protein n=1 Tax=Ideonella alba TaxID=2824118 RepID=UPI001B3691DD|nr:hypothetical protein [Ideonella alba]MBQ0944525.1 hypothetical protein [Ideonella alba]
MGSFYTNHTVRGPSQAQLLEWLHDRPAFVSKVEHGQAVVLDAECEEQDGEVLAGLASQISKQFSCPVLAVLNHDDDVLYFELYENGIKTDEYNSSPSFFDESADTDEPLGGDAERLCSVFNATDPEKVEAALRGDYVFAFKRHRDLALALGLPIYSVGLGYNYVSEGDLPPDAPDGEYKHSEA